MLKWEVKNGDDELKNEIKRVKNTFDEWYKSHWENKYSREQMLSENSPVERVYYKMTKTFEEVKEKYPDETLRACSSCGKHVNKWVQSLSSFYDEYGSDILLCKECVEKLNNLVKNIDD